MDGSLSVTISGEILELLPERAIYWPGQKTLFLCDLHLGRVESLQKKGRAIPQGDTEDTIQRLRGLVSSLTPEKIYVLGDLFHHDNSTEYVVETLRNSFDSEMLERMVLVQGNHDYNVERKMKQLESKIFEPPYLEDPFILTHDPLLDSDYYNLAGHLHPTVEFETDSEYLRRPCFRFDPGAGVLPAFTQLANGVVQEPSENRKLYADAGDTVIKCS